MAQRKIEEAKKVQEEALKLAKDLGNPDLLFEAHILGARVAAAEDIKTAATTILKTLLLETRTPKEKAAVFYELYRVDMHSHYRQNSLDLYQKLYDETPQFIFKQRIQKLILGR